MALSQDVDSDPMLEFRLHVRDISVRLTSEEAEQLVYILRLPHDKDKSALTVLALLEMQGYFSSTKPEGLIEVLKLINRMDLVKMTKTYIKTRKKRKNSASAVDKSTENAHFEVAFIQNLIMTNQLHRTKCVIQDPEAKSKLEAAMNYIKEAKRMLSDAQSLTRNSLPCSSSDDDSGGKQLGEVSSLYFITACLSVFFLQTVPPQTVPSSSKVCMKL